VELAEGLEYSYDAPEVDDVGAESAETTENGGGLSLEELMAQMKSI
jgi:hypothetical protein